MLGNADLIRRILASIRAGDYKGAKEGACRAAARWCATSPLHREACNDDATWAELTRAIFPNARAPNPNANQHPLPGQNGPEPAAPEAWFYFLCDQLKRHRELHAAYTELMVRFSMRQQEQFRLWMAHKSAERAYYEALHRAVVAHQRERGEVDWAEARAEAAREAELERHPDPGDPLYYNNRTPQEHAEATRMRQDLQLLRRYLLNLGLVQQLGREVDADVDG